MRVQLNKVIAEKNRSIIPYNENPATTAGIVHFGVGGFHRSHQAYALQQLFRQNPAEAGSWSICGVGIMQNDIHLIEQLRKQDGLYTLRMSNAKGEVKTEVISVLVELLYGPEQFQQVIEKIAAPETSCVSFTITEGGYNILENTGEFNIEDERIQSDLQKNNLPLTVFGYLARALSLRKQRGLKHLMLLSCDNVQENGEILKKSLYGFLRHYDAQLIDYAEQNISFPNSMVDRITPVTTQQDKERFTAAYGYVDEALVVSEAFFQWVIEKKALQSFPDLSSVGVEYVEDVRPYEKMKLSILNGGHSLVGLTGHALQHEWIHTAVTDPLIAALFDRYNHTEVIPSLQAIDGVDYHAYFQLIRERFSNAMINDSCSRIISESTAKIPKFVLPVIQYHLQRTGNSAIGALILAAWWYYLNEHFEKGTLEEIQDKAASHWQTLFVQHRTHTAQAFIECAEVFGDMRSYPQFISTFLNFTKIIKEKDMQTAISFALNQHDESFK